MGNVTNNVRKSSKCSLFTSTGRKSSFKRRKSSINGSTALESSSCLRKVSSGNLKMDSSSMDKNVSASSTPPMDANGLTHANTLGKSSSSIALRKKSRLHAARAPFQNKTIPFPEKTPTAASEIDTTLCVDDDKLGENSSLKDRMRVLSQQAGGVPMPTPVPKTADVASVEVGNKSSLKDRMRVLSQQAGGVPMPMPMPKAGSPPAEPELAKAPTEGQSEGKDGEIDHSAVLSRAAIPRKRRATQRRIFIGPSV